MREAVTAQMFTQPQHSAKHMEFSIIHWLGNDNNPDATKLSRDKELYYIWALPSLTPAGINVLV